MLTHSKLYISRCSQFHILWNTLNATLTCFLYPLITFEEFSFPSYLIIKMKLEETNETIKYRESLYILFIKMRALIEYSYTHVHEYDTYIRSQHKYELSDALCSNSVVAVESHSARSYYRVELLLNNRVEKYRIQSWSVEQGFTMWVNFYYLIIRIYGQLKPFLWKQAWLMNWLFSPERYFYRRCSSHLQPTPTGASYPELSYVIQSIEFSSNVAMWIISQESKTIWTVGQNSDMVWEKIILRPCFVGHSSLH